MINKLILGTAQLGLQYGINNTIGEISKTSACSILEKASDLGISMLDTAADYGEAEKRIGDFISQKVDNTFNVITKFSKKNGVDWYRSLQKSLKSLNIDKVNIVMFHSYEAFLSHKTVLDLILNEKGTLYDKIGVSVYTNEELLSLVNETGIDLIQCPFNLLDNHSARSCVLKELKDKGKIVHTRSAFLQGLFFMDIRYIPNKLESLIAPLTRIKKIAAENSLSVGHLALQYVLSKQYIDGVLVGVESVEQLVKNANWALEFIDNTVFREIDSIEVEDKTFLNPSLW